MELQENSDQLRRQGLGIAAISYDSPAILKSFAGRRGITFPLLSDQGSRLIRTFGILNESAPKNSFVFGVPHPVTYIVDANGTITSRYSEEDYRNRHTVSNILVEKFNIRTGASESSIETPHLTLTASASNGKVRAGERVRLVIDVRMKSKMHVYAPGVEGYIPVDWTLSPTDVLQDLRASYPPSRKLHLPAINETVPVYEGTFTVQREIIVAPVAKLKPHLGGDGAFVVEGTFKYQACDDKKCFLPQSLPLKWTFKYEPHDSTRAPPEVQHKQPAPRN